VGGVVWRVCGDVCVSAVSPCVRRSLLKSEAHKGLAGTRSCCGGCVVTSLCVSCVFLCAAFFAEE
jgi:hypothetical protein